MGQFGLPRDHVAWAAMLLACLWGVASTMPVVRERARGAVERHCVRTLALLGVLAAALSFGYVAYYLRGGPRIIDATAYWFQAKVFASGHISTPPLEPTAALRGRFLYFEPNLGSLAALFPPGYPAVLALGFLLRAPFAVGAVIAALLVWSTALLGYRLFGRRDVAVLAGLLSLSSAALRYHTADTMSHGLSALLATTAIYAALGDGMRGGLLAGLPLGWLVATRPVTGAVLVLVSLGYRAIFRRDLRWLAACTIGLLPGLWLWFAYQAATTGSWLTPTQMAYYAVADGPPGCFRYGFGKGIGCLFEHGSYVEKRLPNGYGLLQAAYVTLLRLRWHSLDVSNFEPLIITAMLAAVKAVKHRHSRLVVAAIVAVMLGYLPFYFDASYPGGGARLFVDVIPLEQALIAGFIVDTLWLRWFLPLSLLGFAVHGSFEHLGLRDRDGGRPMFETQVVRAAQVGRGIVFVDTDHGYLLGHDPHARNAQDAVVVLHRHGDAHDRVAWERLGRPRAFHYVFDPLAANAEGRVDPISEGEMSALVRFEAESQWPALAVTKGWVRPIYPPNDCSSARRGLSLEPTAGGAAAELSVFAERGGLQRLRLGIVARASGRHQARLTIRGRQYEFDADLLAHQCKTILFEGVELARGEQVMAIDVGRTGVVLDYWTIEP